MVRQIRDAELAQKIREIIAAGEYDSQEYAAHGGSGFAGALLEELLGIEANNAPVPDAVGWEIKTSRGNALVSLFHLSPDNRSSMLPTVQNFGWESSTSPRSFRCTVSSGRHIRGFSIAAAEDSFSLTFDPARVEPENQQWLAQVRESCGGILQDPPTWTWDAAMRSAGGKLRNLMMVKVRARQSRYVSYLSATLYRDFKLSAFQRGIREGFIKIDFDAKTKGKVLRDHGTKFRIAGENLEKLYEQVTPVK